MLVGLTDIGILTLFVKRSVSNSVVKLILNERIR